MKILDYVKNTCPFIAINNNTDYTIDLIDNEIVKEIKKLTECKDLFKQIGYEKTSNKCFNDATLMGKWLIVFRKYKKLNKN